MSNLFKPSWWLSMFLTTLMTMIFIYIIKVACKKFEIPVISNVAEAV